MADSTAAAVRRAPANGTDILSYSPPLRSNEPIGGLGAVIRAKAPVRVSFAGGGTDFPHWFNVRPGAVLCTTINHYARITLYPRQDNAVRIRSVDLGHMVDYKLGDQPVFDDALGLAKATINRLHGHSGMDLDIRCDAPSGSGLGGSSALTAAVIGAVAAYEGRLYSNYELSELNCLVEREDVKIPGGMQDQYATTFGGFNVIEFSNGRTLVNPLRIDPSILNDLEAHLMLCYTGRVRANLGLIDDQIRFYKEHRQATIEGMQRIYELVFEMKEALLRARLDTFGELLHEGFVNKKRMNPEITQGTNAEVLYEEARRSGAIGGKLMGAGGGGYLLLYCHTHSQPQLRKALEAMGGQFTNFSFDHAGLQVWRTHCA
jgi:D-glycero-alpha-D-manno-heptose-7-phosphate kinase